MNTLFLLALFSAVAANVAGTPIAGQGAADNNIVILCRDKEMWHDCGACEGTCRNMDPVCPMICRGGGKPGCVCIEGHVRDEKEGRCIPKSECSVIVEPADIHPPQPAEINPVHPAELHPEKQAADIHPPQPAEINPVHPAELHPEKPADVQPPVCPDKEMWLPCRACEATCSEKEPNCPRACIKPGGCGCIKDHVREEKTQRCIHKSECPKVDLADVRPPLAVINPPLGVVNPPLCSDREKWFPCGACDGTCLEKQPICSKICQPRGSCGCMENHVRGADGRECIHVRNCALNPIFPPSK